MNIYNQILANKKKRKKSFALLIDHEKKNESKLVIVV